ncbi:hypothetical protein BGZ75_005702 [Mortierella antarctica]|nr:hypothetical protein BGZ75_005702 [Mortierella antarctica]
MDAPKDRRSLPPDDTGLVSTDPSEFSYHIHAAQAAEPKRGAHHHQLNIATQSMGASTHPPALPSAPLEANGHRLQRRKAQFELGDGKDEDDEQRDLNRQSDTTKKESEAEDPRPHLSNQDRRAPATLEQVAEAQEEQSSTVDYKGTQRQQEPPVVREDELLAKTLIDSTLTRSMQDLGLHNQQEHDEQPVSARGQEQEYDEQPSPAHRQEQEQIQKQQGAEQSRDHFRAKGTDVHGHGPDSQQFHTATERSQVPHTRTGTQAGHSLEKSKSDPPQVVSNGEGHSEAVHHSSVSIHESQNLDHSPKPRHPGLSRNSSKSKRMSMLLDPSASTTTLPSLTKVTTHTVMAINPKQAAAVGTDPSPSNGTPGTQGFKVSSPTLQSSPAIELVSKFLTSSGAGASSGLHSAAHSVAEDDHSQHHGSGSPGHHRRSPRSAHDKSNATSPQQRSGYTSKFYPVTPSRPQLSSSAPKSSIMSNPLIPPTIVTTSTSDEHLPEMGSAANAAPGGAPGAPFSVSGASAIAAAAVAQSNLAGNGSKTGTLSRTQQKLWLQRENLQDIDEDEMARRGRMQKEMDRINREYKCVRMTLDPSLDSLLRCLARSGKSPLQLQQQQHQQPQHPIQQQQQQQPQALSQNQRHHPPLQHQRSAQQLNGHSPSAGQQQQQHAQTQGRVGLGLHSANQHNGGATVGRNSGKMTLGQMQQLHLQQQQQQQQLLQQQRHR